MTPEMWLRKIINEFLFFREEEGYVENSITIEEDEGFSEPDAPVSEQQVKPSSENKRPAFGSIKILRKNSSAAVQLNDL